MQHETKALQAYAGTDCPDHFIKGISQLSLLLSFSIPLVSYWQKDIHGYLNTIRHLCTLTENVPKVSKPS